MRVKNRPQYRRPESLFSHSWDVMTSSQLRETFLHSPCKRCFIFFLLLSRPFNTFYCSYYRFFCVAQFAECKGTSKNRLTSYTREVNLRMRYCGVLGKKIVQKYGFRVFGPYRSHFLSRKSLIAAKNETKEVRGKIGERDTTSACE